MADAREKQQDTERRSAETESRSIGESKTPESMKNHTPQQQQSVQTSEQHQSLASHFNLYPFVEKVADAIEAGPRDPNSRAHVADTISYFNKCQQLLNSISKSIGPKPNEYVDGQKRNLGESGQLLQQRRELIEEYKKSLEEIMEKEP